MRITAPVRVWAAGEVILLGAVSLAAGLGMAAQPATDRQIGPPFVLLLVGLIGFLVPLEVGLRIPAARERRVFWVGSCLPAAAWLPTLPFAFLRAGPPLGSPAGLLIAGACLVGAVLLVTGGLLAAVETRDRTPDGQDAGEP